MPSSRWACLPACIAIAMLVAGCASSKATEEVAQADGSPPSSGIELPGTPDPDAIVPSATPEPDGAEGSEPEQPPTQTPTQPPPPPAPGDDGTTDPQPDPEPTPDPVPEPEEGGTDDTEPDPEPPADDDADPSDDADDVPPEDDTGDEGETDDEPTDDDAGDPDDTDPADDADEDEDADEGGDDDGADGDGSDGEAAQLSAGLGHSSSLHTVGPDGDTVTTSTPPSWGHVADASVTRVDDDQVEVMCSAWITAPSDRDLEAAGDAVIAVVVDGVARDATSNPIALTLSPGTQMDLDVPPSLVVAAPDEARTISCTVRFEPAS